MNKKTRNQIAAIIVASLVVLTLAAAQQQSTQKTKQVPPPCIPGPEAGFVKSWFGQPGASDHTDTTPISKNTLLICLAIAAPGSSVPPACYVSYENGGHYTLPSHTAINSPKADVITLTCNGTTPTCCKLQIAAGIAAAKKADPNVKLVKPEEVEDKTTKQKPN